MFTDSCDTGGGGGTCLMSRLGVGVGVMFTSSKVIPRILISNVFHPHLISSETVGGGGAGV